VKLRYLGLDALASRPYDLKTLIRVFNHLLLQTGSDVEEALRWMKRIGERYGFFDGDLSFEDFEKALEKEGLVEKRQGRRSLSRKGERIIREDSLGHVFAQLRKDRPGDHGVTAAGTGGERLTETRPWQFGDATSDLDPNTTIRNALKRGGAGAAGGAGGGLAGGLELREEDFEVYDTEHLSSSATVLAIDISHSMILYGEDRFTPAKQVALALTELILRKFKKDSLDIVLFGNEAFCVPVKKLPYVEVGPYYTNTRAGLMMAREILSRKRQANKQIFLITDGKPSVLTERGGRTYRNAFGLDRRIVNKTLEEAALCRRKGIVITTFMIASDTYLQEFVEELTRVNRGRAYFSSPDDVGNYVLVDFLRNRTRRVH